MRGVWLLALVTTATTIPLSAARAERFAVHEIARAGMGDGLPAAEVPIGEPEDIAVDAAGNLYIASYSTIRRVGADGIITTIAGGRNRSDPGDGGLAVDAKLSAAMAVAAGPDGMVYVASYDSVRAISPDGRIDTVLGRPSTRGPLGLIQDLAVNRSGDLFVADEGGNRIWKRSATGALEVFRHVVPGRGRRRHRLHQRKG